MRNLKARLTAILTADDKPVAPQKAKIDCVTTRTNDCVDEPILRYTTNTMGTLEQRGWQNFYKLVKDLKDVRITRI